jgi:hypothetical protein
VEVLVIPVFVFVGLVVLGGIIRFAISEGGIGQMKRAFEAKRAGGAPAARAVIDKALKRPYPVRFAALALLGDREALERELPSLDPVKQGYARAAALLGLAMLGDTARFAELTAHAEAFARDAPKMWSRIKDNVKGIARIGGYLAGGSTDGLEKERPGMYAMNQPWLAALLWEASVRAFERDGKSALAANARQHLAHLDRARQAA